MKISENTENKQFIVSCGLIGDAMVGKTCLAQVFMKETLSDNYVATVFDNFAGSTNVAGDKYTVSMFDTAGQQDYEGLRTFAYKESEVIIVCYSAVDRNSFKSIKDFWIPEMKKFDCCKKPKILVALQTDLRDTKEYDNDTPVSTKEGRAFAKDIGADEFFECSVKSKDGVSGVFNQVVMSAVKRRKNMVNIIKKMFSR